MPNDSQLPNRHSTRKKGYDYSQPGAYFVTVCTQERQPILVDPIVSGIIRDVWIALPNWFPTIGLDEFVIMPNHTHFVLWLMVDPVTGEFGDCNGRTILHDSRRGVALRPPSVTKDHGGGREGTGDRKGPPLQNLDERVYVYRQTGDREGTPLPMDWVIPAAKTRNEKPYLGEVIGAWKSLVTTVYLEWANRHDPSRRAKFWQRNYYDRIVRNDRALSAFRGYVRDNPRNWELDPDNVANRSKLPFPVTIEDYLDDVRRYVKRES